MTLKGDGHLKSKELKHQSLAETSKLFDLETRFGPEVGEGFCPLRSFRMVKLPFRRLNPSRFSDKPKNHMAMGQN